MPANVHPPMLVARRFCWDIASDKAQNTFWVSATTMKYAFGLRPRARADENKVEELARKNWAVLELIARDALASGRVVTDASKGWQIHHEIEDSVFRELFEKYSRMIIR